MLTYVLAVEVITVVLAGVIGRSESVTQRELIWFGLLTAASVIHLEAAQGIERIREMSAEGSPYTHMQSVWFFAGALLLPFQLVTALIAISFTHEWFRVFRGRSVCYRKVFSAATVVLAVAGAQGVLYLFHSGGSQPFAALVLGPLGALAVVLAGSVYRLVNYVLVVGAIAATNPGKPLRNALGHFSDQLIIAAAIGLGYATSVFLLTRPWSAPILLITVLALHMGLLLPQFRAASRTDSKTGLVDSSWWHDRAEEHLARGRRINGRAGVLMIDLDHFKQVNDTYGHLAGDAVLRAVAEAIRHSVRSYDLVGRWGGEEFVVLLPGAGQSDTLATAERIRSAICALNVTTRDRSNSDVTIGALGVSVGAGSFPETATELSPLLLATDDALFRAKDLGRNRTVWARVELPRPRTSSLP
ncbi:MAG TPA: GGDEF domain-containing protein [Pseudonocardiaceae bacterium]|nr:GGDEF domain-containing protein [Pseudonocardiaceae bacterium]